MIAQNGLVNLQFGDAFAGFFSGQETVDEPKAVAHAHDHSGGDLVNNAEQVFFCKFVVEFLRP